MTINKDCTAKMTGSFNWPCRYVRCATRVRFHRKSTVLLYGTKENKGGGGRGGRVLIFQRRGSYFFLGMADGEMSKGLVENSQLFIMSSRPLSCSLKTNACGQMPMSWREAAALVYGKCVLTFMRHEH